MKMSYALLSAALASSLAFGGAALAQTAGSDHMSSGADHMTSGTTDHMAGSGDHMSTGAMSHGAMSTSGHAMKKRHKKSHAAMTSDHMTH